jgi:hypothetical protein
VAECPRAVAREASSRFAQVYAEGAEGADREGWVAQARFPSLEATLWVGCSGLRVGAQRLELGKRGNRTLIAATALGLVIHPFFPMTSRWSFTDTPMHGTLSMVWGVIIFVAVGLSAVAYRGRFRLYAIVTDVVLVGFGMASGIAIQGIEQNDTPLAGAFERINAYALMAWLVVLAVTVMRRSLNRGTPERSVTEVPAARVQTRVPSLAGRG